MTVFIIAALTLDGFIAQETSQVSTAWTSAEDKKWFNERTKQAGVIVMGSKTYETIGRPLPKRLNIVYSRQVPEGELPENLRFTQLTPKELVAQLETEGHKELAVCGGSSIYSMFMTAGVVTKLYLTIEPVLFGQGIKLFSEEVQANLQLVQVHKLSEQTVVLEYDVTRQ